MFPKVMFKLTFREQRQDIRECLRRMPVCPSAPGGALMCRQPFSHKSIRNTERGKDSSLCAELGSADAEHRVACLSLSTRVVFIGTPAA